MGGSDDDFAQIWHRTLDTLDADGVPVAQRAFLQLGKLVGLLDGTAVIAVPNDFSKHFVEQRLRQHVTSALSAELGHEVRLAVTVDSSLAEETDTQLAFDDDPVVDPLVAGLAAPATAGTAPT